MRRLLWHIGLVLTAFDRSARARWVRWCLGPTSLFDRRADFYGPSVEAPFALPSDREEVSGEVRR